MEIVQTIISGFELLKAGLPTIGTIVNYRRKLDDKMEVLNGKMELLSCREADFNEEIEQANGSKVKTEVEYWLRNVRRQRGEVQIIEEKAGKKRYLQRVRFLRKVETKTQELDALLQAGQFPRGIFIQGARERKENEIYNMLMDPNVFSIGIHGRGGVGKTTIVTSIRDRITRDASGFQHVIMATVPQESNIQMLHDVIARAIHFTGLENEQDPVRRVAKLSNALKNMTKFVLILVDMWQPFCLDEIGIPTVDDGKKLIITSQSLEICQRMGCQQCAEVKPLPSEESWYLFKEKLGPERALSPDVEEVARNIAKRCAGLPLAIITAARSMRDAGNNDIREWRQALDELQRLTRGLTIMDMEFVFKLLQFSYNRLKDVRLQHCLLYCALFPEDYKIERNNLISYWIGEGLIDEMGSRQAQLNWGHSLLNRLEEAYMLEHCRSTEPSYEDYRVPCVEMHDMVRDLALHITGVKPLFLVRAGIGLARFPSQKEWLENLEKVSLMVNRLRKLPEMSPICPELQTLLLQDNFIFELPNSFFVYMYSLRVLDLSNLKIYSLPDSFSDLEGLRGLYLNNCSRLAFLPSFEKLTELREIDLAGSGLQALPDGMDKLVNLRRVDLYRTRIKTWSSAPRGMLANLSHIQHLRSDDIYIGNQEEIYFGLLATMRQMEVFGAAFSYPLIYNEYIKSGHWKRLRHYHLGATSIPGGTKVRRWAMQERLNCRRVYMESCDFKDRIGGLIPFSFPINVQELVFLRCHDLTSLSDISSSLLSASDLERCWIGICEGMECLWEELGFSERQTNRSNLLFTSLRVLILFQLTNLGVVFNLAPRSKTFSSLTTLSVGFCHQLKYVFTPEVLQNNLRNLQVLHIHNCATMEDLILEETEEEELADGQELCRTSISQNYDSSSTITLTKLQSLELENLPNLKSIFKGTIMCKALQQIVVRNCPMLKRLPLMVMRSHHSLLKIFGSQAWWESLEWDDPDEKRVFESMFDTKMPYPFGLRDDSRAVNIWMQDLERYEMI